MLLAELNPIKTVKDLNEVHEAFWTCKTRHFLRHVEAHPEHVAAQISKLSGFYQRNNRPPPSLESLMAEAAPRHLKGAQAKADAYLGARLFVKWLHRLWRFSPTLYGSNLEFAKQASQAIHDATQEALHAPRAIHGCGLEVEPLTIGQWLKEFKLRSPRRKTRGP